MVSNNNMYLTRTMPRWHHCFSSHHSCQKLHTAASKARKQSKSKLSGHFGHCQWDWGGDSWQIPQPDTKLRREQSTAIPTHSKQTAGRIYWPSSAGVPSSFRIVPSLSSCFLEIATSLRLECTCMHTLLFPLLIQKQFTISSPFWTQREHEFWTFHFSSDSP